MAEVHIRGLSNTTKTALQELARQRNISLNRYIVEQLELIARDKLTLETLETLHRQTINNTHVLLRVEQLLLDFGVGGGLYEEADSSDTE